MNQKNRNDTATPSATAAHRKRQETVLVVDDDDAVRRLMTRLLTASGFNVLPANGGPEALPIWDCHQSGIDLLLTDVVMPGGMSGLALADRLRVDRPTLRVLYTSGYDTDIAGSGGVLREGLNFLQKPYRPEQLLTAVRSALAANPASPEAAC